MSPEAKARLAIDERIQQAGWLLQDARQINLQQEVVEHLEATLSSFRKVAVEIARSK